MRLVILVASSTHVPCWLQCVESSAVPNLAQLVGTQSGEVVVPVYDWATFLDVKKLLGIKRHQQFYMDNEHQGSNFGCGDATFSPHAGPPSHLSLCSVAPQIVIAFRPHFPGVVHAKARHSSEATTEHVMLAAIPDGMPRVVPPEGLSLKRRQYLAKEIREFCSEETRDLVCPLVEGILPIPYS